MDIPALTTSNSSQPLFHGRTIVLATMHQKERAIAPILEHHLGARVIVPQDFNTDEFGTFTRTVKRPSDQVNTARIKAEKAMALTGLTVAIASEGSFGPHPAMPLLRCDYEIVMLCDRTHDLELVGCALSTDTNYSHQQVTSLEAALAFAKTIGFPSHGLVAMPDAQPSQSSSIVKGIVTEIELVETVTCFLKDFGQVHLETDMRAMHNPMRMQVIAQATQDLVKKLSRCCPQCGFPGFAPTEYKPGLPCALCGLPTRLTLAVINRCQRCQFTQSTDFPDGHKQADPSQCSYCNP